MQLTAWTPRGLLRLPRGGVAALNGRGPISPRTPPARATARRPLGGGMMSVRMTIGLADRSLPHPLLRDGWGTASGVGGCGRQDVLKSPGRS